MTYNIEEEAKRFIDSKKTQFLEGLNQSAEDIMQYINDNMHTSDDRRYAAKSMQEVVLWCRSCLDKHGIK